MTDPLDGLPLMAAPEPQMPPPASAPGADAEVETLRARVRSQRVARDAASVIENPKTGSGGGGNSSKLPLLGKLTSMLSGAGKMGKKKWLVVGVVGVVLIVIGVAAMFVWPMIFGGGEFSAAPTVSAPVFEPPPGPVVVQPTTPWSGWDYTFKVPQSRSEWGLGWELTWVMLVLVILFFRSEARHRGEEWDFYIVGGLLLLAMLIMVAAKGFVVVAVDQCVYWAGKDCPMNALSLDMINTGSMFMWVVAFMVVFIGGAASSLTGKVDLTPWAVGTFIVGVLAKLLLPAGVAQTFAVGVIALGVLIYLCEIGGLSGGKLTVAGLFTVAFGILVMVVATVILTLAFRYLANAAMVDYPVLATWLYQARFVCGLVTGWLVATTITYAATPAVPPQIQRLGSGSVVVGDSEKIDAVIFLLMTLGVIFVMNWAPALAKLM